jgi:UDP-glucose:(heptosyl)LPS alpha-1,3-glucosyltransferase
MRLALNFRRVDPSRGGAETYVVDLCRRLIDRGHQLDLYAESWAPECLPAEVRRVAVAAPGRTRIGQVWGFARNSAAALEKQAYDCTIGLINTWAHDVIIPQGGTHRGSVLANSQRFPAGLRRSLYTLSKSTNPKNRIYRAIERRQYDPARGAHVVAVSKMVKNHLEEFHHVPYRRIHVVPNAIDPKRLAVPQPGATRCALRNKLGIQPRDLVGLYVGHNFALKGLGKVLEALSARARNDPAPRPIRLLVCGGGKVERYRRLAHQLGLGETVHFLGFFPDVRACYWSSDFFVLPSYYDPCSLVVFEALACGLPVISTSCNGATEVLTDGREGYVLTSPNAVGELVTALDRMTLDDHRREMAEAATRLGQIQTLDAHVDRLVEVFEVVARAKSHGAKSPHMKKVRVSKSEGADINRRS